SRINCPEFIGELAIRPQLPIHKSQVYSSGLKGGEGGHQTSSPIHQQHPSPEQWGHTLFSPTPPETLAPSLESAFLLASFEGANLAPWDEALRNAGSVEGAKVSPGVGRDHSHLPEKVCFCDLTPRADWVFLNV